MAAALLRGAARELALLLGHGHQPPIHPPGLSRVAVNTTASSWLPSLQCVRHGSKAVTRHKKAMHFERQKILALTEYIPPKPSLENCFKPRPKRGETNELNPMEEFLCTQLSAVLQDSKIVAVFQRNAIGAEDFLLLRHRLFKHGIHIKVFSKQVLKKVLDPSPLQGLLPLFIGQTFLVVSSEPKVKEMMQAARTVPQIELLGAFVEDRLLSRQGVVNYSKLPSKEMLQGQLVGTLTNITTQTSHLLAHHSAHLCRILEQRRQKEDASS